MVYRASVSNKKHSIKNSYLDYLNYLEKKEKQILFSLRKIVISHGRMSAYVRIFKGLILGIGLGNLLIQKSKQYPFIYYLAFFALFFCLSILLINYERRHYKRKGLMNSIKIGFKILLLSFLFSSFVLIYTNYKNFIVVVAVTMFFSSLAYSME